MSDLDARYGRRRSDRSAGRWAVVAATSVLLVVVVAFWWATQGAEATVEAQIGRFSRDSAEAVTVTARVSAHPGTPVACAFAAHSDSNSVVGYTVVELPPIDEQHRSVTVTLRTTGPASSVVARDCWVPSAGMR